jgi:hypothetical protein
MYLHCSKTYFGVWLPQDLPSGRRLRLLKRLRSNFAVTPRGRSRSLAADDRRGAEAEPLGARASFDPPNTGDIRIVHNPDWPIS